MRKNSVLKTTCAVIAWAAMSGPGFADSFTFGGRIKQGISLAYDLPGQNEELGPANFLAEAEATYSPDDTLTLTANLWLRGDFFPDIGGSIVGGGIQDFTSPFFRKQFGFRLNEDATGAIPTPFGDDAHAMRWLDDFNDDMIRELSARYQSPSGAVAIKIGKFQRGWGQSDGLRLLDILHAQDLRERFVLRDSDETRIPAWMATVDLDLERIGVAAPFEAIGFDRPKLELIAIPEVRHTNVVINNPTPSNRSSGGIFGLPFPLLIDPRTGWGMPFAGANLGEKAPDEFSFDEGEYAASFSFEALDAEWSLKGFYGWQDMPVVTLTGADLLLGTALNDPAAAAVVIPLNAAQTVGALHAPGQYLDFIYSVSIGAPIAFPLAPFGCTNPLFGPPDCSLNLNFDMDYNHRQKVVGASMTREMRELTFGPKSVSPVLRVEASYEFDKPFNVSRALTPFATVATGAPALVLDPSVTVVERDQWQLMVGLDYFLWVPFWEGQANSIFTSLQFFNVHTNKHDGLLQQAPYASAEVEENHNYVTLLWNTTLDDGRLFLEGLAIDDIDNSGFIYRQRIDFNYFGDRIRPRLEWISFDGKREAGPAGLFEGSDLVEFSMNVQF